MRFRGVNPTSLISAPCLLCTSRVKGNQNNQYYIISLINNCERLLARYHKTNSTCTWPKHFWKLLAFEKFWGWLFEHAVHQTKIVYCYATLLYSFIMFYQYFPMQETDSYDNKVMVKKDEKDIVRSLYTMLIFWTKPATRLLHTSLML